VPEFREWPKIPRWERPVVITEKIDGTNACVIVEEREPGDLWVFAQSRTRIITPGKPTDNFGFAAWVAEHKCELARLGPGYHYGEWFGSGIQRGYGLDEKRFALFNVDRWRPERWSDPEAHAADFPACCDVVPVLARCSMSDAGEAALAEMDALHIYGSRMVPGFMRPEGIVIYHQAARVSFKMTLEGDSK
jgi:hypothetical protein